MNTSQHRAFVLMPFEEPFNAIYSQLISPALQTAGYEVRRADSVLDQQNVLRDIVTGIDTADLIVADLTGLNPNVFYELGIAHGLGIPTAMLTQDIDDVPFDLRAYRVKEYSDRFDKAAELQRFLQLIAVEHVKGEVTFGSPVSDFLPGGQAAQRLKNREAAPASAETEPSGSEAEAPATADESEDDDHPETKGMLDLIADMMAASEATMSIGERISSETEAITTKIGHHTKSIEKAASASSGTIPAAQIVARALAGDLENYAQSLKEPVREMNEVSHLFSDSSLVWLSRIEITSDNRGEVKDFAQNLSNLQDSITQTRESMLGFREAIESTKGWSARVDRANRKVIAQIDNLVSSFDYLLASTSRGREIIEEKLADVE